MVWDLEGPMAMAWSFGHARIGIGMSADDRDERGVVVSSVAEDSPADRAGLQVGDIIVAIDGHTLLEPLEGARERNFDEDDSLPVQRLMALARDWEEGDQVEVRFERDGAIQTVTVEPEEMGFDMEPLRLRIGEFNGRMRELGPRLERELMVVPPRPDVGSQIRIRGREGALAWFDLGTWGLELREVTPELGRYFGADEGVLVLDASEDSELGLEAGDVILAIDGRDVETPRDVRRVLRSYEPGESLTFQIMRDGVRTTVEYEMS
jgi:S1-C subfamily serine protease